jgi:6-phosphogluconolactonase/glucosamine-6-phosphate isomerase/deaminase
MRLERLSSERFRMETEVCADETCAAQAAVKAMAAEARSAVADRGEFVMAVSGGRTQWILQRTLTEEELHGSAFVSSR